MGQVAWKMPAFEERHRPRLPIPIPMRESAREAVAKEDILCACLRQQRIRFRAVSQWRVAQSKGSRQVFQTRPHGYQ
jgi:hypothetical protein